MFYKSYGSKITVCNLAARDNFFIAIIRELASILFLTPIDSLNSNTKIPKRVFFIIILRVVHCSLLIAKAILHALW